MRIDKPTYSFSDFLIRPRCIAEWRWKCREAQVSCNGEIVHILGDGETLMVTHAACKAPILCIDSQDWQWARKGA